MELGGHLEQLGLYPIACGKPQRFHTEAAPPPSLLISSGGAELRFLSALLRRAWRGDISVNILAFITTVMTYLSEQVFTISVPPEGLVTLVRRYICSWSGI